MKSFESYLLYKNFKFESISMIRKFTKPFYFFVFLFILVSCSTVAVQRELTGEIPGNKNVKLDDIEITNAIKKACYQRGWKNKLHKKEKYFSCRLDREEHIVKIRIYYSQKYKIVYENSFVMEYEKGYLDDYINRNYNRWAEALSESIEFQLKQTLYYKTEKLKKEKSENKKQK